MIFDLELWTIRDIAFNFSQSTLSQFSWRCYEEWTGSKTMRLLLPQQLSSLYPLSFFFHRLLYA